MTSNPYDRQFVIPSGAVLKEGGSLNLTKGQIGLFSIMDTTENGLQTLFDLKGVSKKKLLEIRAGRGLEETSRSSSNKDFSTPPFSLSDVLEIVVSMPQSDEQSVDIVNLGYDGINEDTAIKLRKGDSIPVYIELSGRALTLIGEKSGRVVIKDYIGAEPCDWVNPMSVYNCDPCSNCDPIPCGPYIRKFIDRVLNTPLKGLKKVSDYINVRPSLSCQQTPASLVPYSFWTTSICDTGDNSALAIIQSQYPTYKITRDSRDGAISTYKMLVPDFMGTPAPVNMTYDFLVKGCTTCPATYTKIRGGFIYSVKLNDNGVDQSSTIEGLPNAVAGSAIRVAGSEGIGYYTVVLTAKLSQAQISTFVDTNPTFIINTIANISDYCSKTTTSTAAWEKGETCNVASVKYIIDIPDEECMDDRLAELARTYPELTITLETPAVDGGCRKRYATNVDTELVCDECDPIFKDFFRSKVPADFYGNKWRLADAGTDPVDCLCGVVFEGKKIMLDPGECLLSDIDYFEDSVRIRVSAGLPEDAILNTDTYDSPVSVSYLSKWKQRTHLGGNLRRYETESFKYFTGDSKHADLFARFALGEESDLKGSKQYVDYRITIQPKKMSNITSDWTQDTIDFHIAVEIGKGKDVEQLLNNIAAAAGIDIIRSLGV